jgi:hypothetical protein
MGDAIHAHVGCGEFFPRHRTRTSKDGTPFCNHLHKIAIKNPNWRKFAGKLRDRSGCGCPIYARVLITNPITKEVL